MVVASLAILWVAVGVLRGDGDDGWDRRSAPALAWTGDDGLFVYGGTPVPPEDESVGAQEPLNDAALFDPDTGERDDLPAPPFDRPLWRGPVAAAFDDQVLVMGQRCNPSDDDERACAPGGYRAAVYSGAERAWRELDLPGPLSTVSNGQSHLAGVTDDGRVVLVLGSRDGFGELASRQVWVYTPDEDLWEALPAPGGLVEDVCVTGSTVVVGSGLVAATSPAEGASLRVLDLDDGSSAWFPSPPSGVAAEANRPGLACGDDVVLVASGVDSTRTFVLGGAGGWQEPAPRPGDDVFPQHLWTGEEFLFLGSNASPLAYDPTADEWRGLEEGEATGPQAVWTGEVVAGWPGRTDVPVAFPVS